MGSSKKSNSKFDLSKNINPTDGDKGKSGKSKTWLFVLLGALLLGAGAWYFLSNSKSNSSPSSDKSITSSNESNSDTTSSNAQGEVSATKTDSATTSATPENNTSSNYWGPVRTYNHPAGCSITGGYIYRGSKYNELYGKYFYTDYCASNIHYLVPNGAGGFTDTDLGNLGASSVVAFGVDKNGELYCAAGSRVYRFSSADCTPVASITNGTDTITDCGRGYVNLSCVFNDNYFYNWYADGALFASDTSAIQVAATGNYVIEVINGACVNRDTIHVDLVTGLNVTFTGLDTLYCVYNSTAFLFPNLL